MIPIACPECGTKLKVKDSLAGKRVHCPRCKAVVVVPKATTTTGPPESASKVNKNFAEDATIAPQALNEFAEDATVPPHAPKPGAALPVQETTVSREDDHLQAVRAEP